MSAKQTKIALGLFGLVVVCWVVSPFLLSSRETAQPLPQFPLLFDGSQAIQATREFVVRYPRRVLGSLEARQSTGYLRQRLEPLGYEISYTHFDATIAGRKQVGRNVLAYKAGQVPEILAIVAHYDTARTTVQGAMDDGSGIGVLVELARVFANAPTHWSLLFIASDGEEWGMLGALDISQSYPERNRIVAVLSLDYVAPGDLEEIELETVGQIAGYTPPWLRKLARAAAEAEQIPVSEPSGLREHLDRAFLLSWTDQGPFLGAGIPAINLGSASKDAPVERAIYHADRDTIENLRPASVEKYGRIAERIVRAIDAMPSVPRESMGSFRCADDLWLPGTMMTFLHYLAFLPLPVLLLFHFINRRHNLNAGRLQRELLAYVGTLIPFLALYYLIILFQLLGQIPRYSFYPAPPRDPVLEAPAWGVLSGIFGIAMVVAVICYFSVKLLTGTLPRPDYGASKLLLLGILTLVVVLALIYNSFWAVAFLLLPAWIWALVGTGMNLRRRVIARVLILAAGIPYYLATVFCAARLGLGWKLIWYETLALSSGMFNLAGYLLAAATIAVGIRFLAIQRSERGA